MSDWRNEVAEERPTFAPSTLASGEEMTLRFEDDGREKQTRQGDAIVFAVTVLDAPTGAQDMNDEEIEEGGEYELMTSSSRLLYQLSEAAEDLAGEELTIRAEGAPQSFDRHYFAE